MKIMMQTSKLSSAEKRIHPSPYIIYLGVFINENLNWKIQINEISTKFIKGNAMFSKVRDFLKKILYFFSHLAYLGFVWGQGKFSLNKITLVATKESH